MDKVVRNIIDYKNQFKDQTIYAGRRGLMNFNPQVRFADELLVEHPLLDVHCQLLNINPDLTVDDLSKVPDSIPYIDMEKLPPFVHPFVKEGTNDVSNEKQTIDTSASGVEANTTSQQSSDDSTDGQVGIDGIDGDDNIPAGDGEHPTSESTTDQDQPLQETVVLSHDAGEDDDRSGPSSVTSGSDSTNADNEIISGESEEADSASSDGDLPGSGPDGADDDQTTTDHNTTSESTDGATTSEPSEGANTPGSEGSGSGNGGNVDGDGESVSGVPVDLDSLSTKELKAKCTELELGTSGTRAQMIKRIKKHLEG